MDPLIQIADAVVADLETVQSGSLGLVFEAVRDEIPAWDTSSNKATENSKARVYAAATGEEGEHDSRAEYLHRATVKLAVGAWTCLHRDHRDQLSALANAIAERYRHVAYRNLTFEGGEAYITNAQRTIVYDGDLLRSEGAYMGNIDLTIEFKTSTSNEA
jgi:hypothetical protein